MISIDRKNRRYEDSSSNSDTEDDVDTQQPTGKSKSKKGRASPPPVPSINRPGIAHTGSSPTPSLSAPLSPVSPARRTSPRKSVTPRRIPPATHLQDSASTLDLFEKESGSSGM